MIRIRAAALLACSLAFAAFADPARETRPVSGFHGISMGVAMDLEVIQDGSESLALEGDADVLSRIDTSVALALSISGSGDMDIARIAAKGASFSISGVGNVRYYGDPQLARAIRGVGHVERIAANP